MSWIHRCVVRVGTFAGLACLLLSAAAPGVYADAMVRAVFQGQTFVFTHVSGAEGKIAVGIDDPSFRALLRADGTRVTWKTGDRNVLLTTASPAVVTFTVGDLNYDVGPNALKAAFAPYEQNGEVYLPFDAVVSSLGLAWRNDGNSTILQPQLDAIDVLGSGSRVDIVAHGGATLRPHIVQLTSNQIGYEFDGVGTPLIGERQVSAGGVRSLQIAQAGTVRDPKTIVTVALLDGTTHEAPRSTGDREVTLSFASGSAAPAPEQSTPPVNGRSIITGVTVTPNAGSFTVSIAISGNAVYQWHHQEAPDNSFWIDFQGAQLQGAPIARTEPAPIGALSVRQVTPDIVRVAFSLTGPYAVLVSPTQTGIAVSIRASPPK